MVFGLINNGAELSTKVSEAFMSSETQDSKCTFKRIVVITAVIDTIISAILVTYSVLHYIDARHFLDTGKYKYHFIHCHYCFSKRSEERHDVMRIYLGILGIILNALYLLVACSLIFFSYLECTRWLFAWVFTSGFLDLVTMVFIALLYVEEKWLSFVLTLVAVAFKVWEIAVVIALIWEIQWLQYILTETPELDDASLNQSMQVIHVEKSKALQKTINKAMHQLDDAPRDAALVLPRNNRDSAPEANPTGSIQSTDNSTI